VVAALPTAPAFAAAAGVASLVGGIFGSTFQQAVGAIDYTFNWFYTDNKDISYFSSGLLPNRATGFDWDLPRWGDLAYDDKGTLPFAAHPRATNPSSGYLVSWNNKTAPGFSAADNQWGYGAIYRSLALEDRVKARIAGAPRSPARSWSRR